MRRRRYQFVPKGPQDTRTLSHILLRLLKSLLELIARALRFVDLNRACPDAPTPAKTLEAICARRPPLHGTRYMVVSRSAMASPTLPVFVNIRPKTAPKRFPKRPPRGYRRGHYFTQLSKDAPTYARRFFARCGARASSYFQKAPWPVLRCLYSSMSSQGMAEAEAAAADAAVMAAREVGQQEVAELHRLLYQQFSFFEDQVSDCDVH